MLEISATLRRMESELEGREREIYHLRRKNAEFARVLSAQSQEVELRLPSLGTFLCGRRADRRSAGQKGTVLPQKA